MFMNHQSLAGINSGVDAFAELAIDLNHAMALCTRIQSILWKIGTCRDSILVDWPGANRRSHVAT